MKYEILSQTHRHQRYPSIISRSFCGERKSGGVWGWHRRLTIPLRMTGKGVDANRVCWCAATECRCNGNFLRSTVRARCSVLAASWSRHHWILFRLGADTANAICLCVAVRLIQPARVCRQESFRYDGTLCTCNLRIQPELA